MSLKLIAKVESFGPAGYIAFIDSIKGLVVQAKTPQEAIKELLLSFKAKIAFDYNIKIDSIQEQEFESEEALAAYERDIKEGENEINLSLY
ncbi:putative RNase H-like HicB family nuclease [Mucilaginibacter sp. SG538B]|uniref:hypothetical protein n=1 Tax=Mucilaginibacter sp. SG538B TaxID=2587021 RepID=UPI00159EA885|nr:hypothetical protein [Mucilaginibacter sp. SG538B]NVM61731.1 putative RNase H-like HicB family nuclease [Mucilaginibacter sp. SG538B]